MLNLRETNRNKTDMNRKDVTQLTQIRHPEFTVRNFRSPEPSVIVCHSLIAYESDHTAPSG